jgi:hypothetical protein
MHGRTEITLTYVNRELLFVFKYLGHSLRSVTGHANSGVFRDIGFFGRGILRQRKKKRQEPYQRQKTDIQQAEYRA